MAQAMKTRFVGFATDSTRHPLAPVEVVYEVERTRRMRTPLWARIVVPGCLLYLVYGAVRAIVFWTTGTVI